MEHAVGVQVALVWLVLKKCGEDGVTRDEKDNLRQITQEFRCLN